MDQEETDENGDPLPGDIDDAEARLAYVAVTRASHRRDVGGLGWINQHLDPVVRAILFGNSAPPPPH